MPKNNCRIAQMVALTTIAVLLAGCTKKQADQPKQAEAAIFKAQAMIPVTFTLQKEEGQTGRTSPISNNYRPQVRFPLAASDITCKVDLPAASPSLDPGQTANASLTCDEEVRVERGKQEFTLFEGGKQVGKGAVQVS